MWQVIRMAIPTLAAGNTVLLKHSSNVQGCALKIEDIIQKATNVEHAFRTLKKRFFYVTHPHWGMQGKRPLIYGF